MATDRDSEAGTKEMTKQQEIRAWLLDFCDCGQHIDGRDFTCKGCNPGKRWVDDLLSYLRSKDVAIKREVELPCNPNVNAIFESKKKNDIKMALAENEIYEAAQMAMLKAGYAAWEPLIGDKDG